MRVRTVRQEGPPDYQAVLAALSRTGDFKDGVLKVNIPVVFLHYYGTGPASKLAQGVRAAIDHTGKSAR